MSEFSGDTFDEKGVPELVDFIAISESDDDFEDCPSHIYGNFPWKRQLCLQTNFEEQVNRWERLPLDYRDEALFTMRKILMSPFLYSNAKIPWKWIRWASEIDLIEYDRTLDSETLLPAATLQRKHVLAVVILDIAFEKVKEFSRETKTASAVLQAMYQFKDFPCDAVNIAISAASSRDEPIRMMGDYISDRLKQILSPDDNVVEYTKRPEIRILASLLACRQFAEGLCIITCECRDIVEELKYHNVPSGFLRHLEELRENAKAKYSTGKFKEAYEEYTMAIKQSEYDGVNYSNRCQVSIKLQAYESALSDAFRAVILKPNWAKVYHKMMTCLYKMSHIKEALYWGAVGIDKCKSDPDYEQLECLHKKIADIQEEKENMKTFKTADENAESKNLNFENMLRKSSSTKKSRKKQSKGQKDKKNKKKNIQSSTNIKSTKNSSMRPQTPPMYSDDEEWDANQGEERGGLGMIQITELEPEYEVIEKKNAELEIEKEKKRNEQRKKDEEKRKRKERDEKKRKEEEERRRKELEATKLKEEEKQRKKQEEEKRRKTQQKEEDYRKREQELEKERIRLREELEKEKEEEIKKMRLEHEKELMEIRLKDKEILSRREKSQELTKKTMNVYESSVVEGTASLLGDRFVDAVKHYTTAIEFLKEDKTYSVLEKDIIVLYYARGTASLKQMTPSEIDISISYFSRIIDNHKSFGHIPMIYYSLGRANYYLNNFVEAKKKASIGFECLRKFQPRGLLTWPGSKHEIHESNSNNLRKFLKDLIQQCNVPPRPTAVCRYDMCSRDHHRKEIYMSDLNFEGFFTVTCEWKCITCFHLKCWAKFKHDFLNILGDKDVLGTFCPTPDCGGRIVEIEMSHVDMNDKRPSGAKKTWKGPDKIAEKVVKYNQRCGRMPKSSRNYELRLRAIDEARKRKLEKNQELPKMKNSKMKKNEIEQLPVDADYSNATVYFKQDGPEVSQKLMVAEKMMKNNRTDSIALRSFYFASDITPEMEIAEIEEVFERSKNCGKPITLPDDLREEIDTFEFRFSDEDCLLIFTEEERPKIPFILEYFQNFFKTNGPCDIADALFTDMITALPESMQEIILKRGDAVEFLTCSWLFLRVSSFIGNRYQQSRMQCMAGDNSQDNTNKRRISIDIPHTSEHSSLSGDGWSQFKQDLFMNPSTDNFDPGFLTGSSVDLLDQFEDEKVRKPVTPSETSSLFSFEDELRSESGSLASVDFKGSQEKQYSYLNLIKGPREPALNVGSPTFASHGAMPKEKGKKKGNRVEAGTQTEGRDEAEKAKEEVERLLQRIEMMEDNHTKLKRTSHAREEALLKQVEAAESSEKMAQEEVERMKQQVEAESARVGMIKRKYMGKKQDSEEKVEESRRKELEAEHNFTALSSKMQSMREDLLKRIFDLEKQKNKSEKDANEQLVRAIKAEVDLVKSQESFIMGSFVKAKEAIERSVKEFAQEMAKPHQSKIVVQSLSVVHEMLMANARACSNSMETIKSAYLSIVNEINAGRQLASMLPLLYLEPPPAGPDIQEVLMQAKQRELANSVNGAGDAPNGIASEHSSQNHSRTIQRIATQHPRRPQSSSRSSQSPNPTSRQASATSQVPQPRLAGAVGPLPVATKKITSFQQLVTKLANDLPNLSREQIEHYAQRVRKANKGLSGLKHEDILKRILNLVEDNHVKIGVRPNMKPGQYGSPGNPHGLAGFSQVIEVEDDDVVCPICCDPLRDGIFTLECSHKFHVNCISKWMQKQRTCPNCRKPMTDLSKLPMIPSGENREMPPGLARPNGHNYRAL